MENLFGNLLFGLIYPILLFVTWWLPALVYYLLGLYFLGTLRRKRTRALVWLATFAVMFAYTAYGGLYLNFRLEQRGKTYANFVKFADVPADVSAIMLSRSQENDTLTGYAQGCSVVCVKLLLSGRFKTVIVAIKDYRLFSYKEEIRRMALNQYVKPESYRIFTVVDEPGCKNYPSADLYQQLEAWRLFGRCVHERRVKKIEGRYLEVTVDEDTPGKPPWKLRFTTHVRVIDGGKITDIARAEYASVDLAFWIPVPGIFPHGAESGFPTKFWPDVLRFEHHYGPFKTSISIIEDLTGVPLSAPVPLPNFQKQTPEDRLKLARHMLLHSFAVERGNFVKNQLADERPFSRDFRDLILDFIARTKLSGNSYHQMIPYIAWLAAGDPGFAPVIAKIYVARAADSVEGASYVRALSYFGPGVLAPYAPQLLALYDRDAAKASVDWKFRAALNFGLGGAGPAVIDKLIEQIDVPSPDLHVAASAAASLCRAGDPRAVAPLLRKVTGLKGNDYPMAYAYALARLGHGKEAQDAIAHIRVPQSSESKCLSEIIEKYPTGGAPDSICILQGPYQQSKDAAWQYSDSEVRCLAPRTPAPNG